MKGVSGGLFITTVLIVAGLVFAIGLFLRPAGLPDLSGLAQFVWHVLVKVGLVAIGASLLGLIVFTQVADLPPTEIVPKIQGIDNLSYGVLAAGIFGVVTIAVTLASATSFNLYLYELFTKGSLGLVLAVLATLVFAFLLGVRSLDALNERFIRDARNNQMVILLVVVWNSVMFIAMSS